LDGETYSLISDQNYVTKLLFNYNEFKNSIATILSIEKYDSHKDYVTTLAVRGYNGGYGGEAV